MTQLSLVHNMTKLTEGSEYWTPGVMAQALLGLRFAASHQPWMNLHFVLLELCARPEYAQLLRQKIDNLAVLDYDKLENLPLLDSFIKETVRMNPLDTRLCPIEITSSSRHLFLTGLIVAIRRKALQDFTFSDGGPYVPAGSTACVSSYDLMHDENSYPNASKFDGRRFVSGTSRTDGTRFTDVSDLTALETSVCRISHVGF